MDAQPLLRRRAGFDQRDLRVRSSSQPMSPERPKSVIVPTSLSQAQNHETLEPEDELSAHTVPMEAAPPVLPPVEGRPVNKRISQIANQARDEKRSSQVSTTSAKSTVTDRPLKKYVGPWELGRTLGKGATGHVRLCRHAATGQLAAAKVVNKRMSNLARTDSIQRMDRILATRPFGESDRHLPFQIERETAMLKLIDHPNIVRCFDVWENRGEL